LSLVKEINFRNNLFIAESSVIVIGGNHRYVNSDGDKVGESTADIETIHLSGDGTGCSSVKNYPLELEEHTATYHDGSVFVCGGHNSEEASYTNRCFQLSNPVGPWTEIFPMPEPNSEMRSSLIDGKWFITGGLRGPGTKSFVYDFDDKLFEYGSQLFDNKYDHCQVTVNDTHVFIGGGSSIEAYLFNWKTQRWTFLDDMPSSVLGGACGFLNNPEYGRGKLLQGDV